MKTKQHILLILFALCFATTVRAQLAFASAEWDFGPIAEADGRVSHTFTGINQGDKPLVILDVVTSCGCTVPSFSRKPILPGEKTQIIVTFDPINRPGAFTKELGVYSSERRRIATLTVKGNVSPRQKSVEELYPVDAGGGLRLTSTLCSYVYIYPGRHMQSSVSYINTSGQKIRLELRPYEQTGLLTVNYPREIAPGERGEINLSYLNPAANPRYGTLRDVLQVVTDGRSNKTLLMAHGIGVDNPADNDPAKAPQVQLSESIIKFGPVKHTGPILRHTFVLANTGTGELIVRAVENNSKVSTTLTPGRRIAPGDNCRVEVIFDPSAQNYGAMSDHLLLITNDPARPMHRLRVTAIVEN